MKREEEETQQIVTDLESNPEHREKSLHLVLQLFHLLSHTALRILAFRDHKQISTKMHFIGLY